MLLKTSIAALALCAAAFSLGAGLPSSQDGAPEGAPAGLSMEQMMAMMELAQPGPEHEEFARRVGEWDAEISMQMMPGAPAQVVPASASARTILGGRYLEITTKGSMMGMPTESIAILGFDRRHGEYTLIGLDTMGTYWVTGQGKRGEDGVLRMRGEDDEPMGKQVYTFEYKFLGPDEHEFRVLFHELGPQKFDPPFQMVKVHSKRKGA